MDWDKIIRLIKIRDRVVSSIEGWVNMSATHIQVNISATHLQVNISATHIQANITWLILSEPTHRTVNKIYNLLQGSERYQNDTGFISHLTVS